MSTGTVVRKAFVKSLPVMAAYVILGMGFGILMDDRGFSPWWSVLCSVVIFAGAMQYLTADLLAAAVSPVYAALMTLAVNARHLFYGISMIGKYRGMGKLKPYIVFGLTDETYSLLCDGDWPGEGRQRELYCFLVTLFNQCYWVAGCTAGAVLGELLDFNSRGIDFSMTALFVTVFVDQWMAGKERRPALVGIGSATVCLLLFGESGFLIPAMVLISLLLSTSYRKGARSDG